MATLIVISSHDRRKDEFNWVAAVGAQGDLSAGFLGLEEELRAGVAHVGVAARQHHAAARQVHAHAALLVLLVDHVVAD
eukprot:CAMPEP_0197586032 /NCGR_PEP_ID=MMETSP1326-20131121/8153_1 /TAXON_ID=1155430 /ORGANISM="Genus nov. species nov., Strain RCC2288" /LENGTH=78 /DNA_ID=CAMNT_0043150619 /DNA_START=210 /DNA_END=444 /DNA_ORIENTATION=-